MQSNRGNFGGVSFIRFLLDGYPLYLERTRTIGKNRKIANTCTSAIWYPGRWFTNPTWKPLARGNIPILSGLYKILLSQNILGNAGWHKL